MGARNFAAWRCVRDCIEGIEARIRLRLPGQNGDNLARPCATSEPLTTRHIHGCTPNSTASCASAWGWLTLAADRVSARCACSTTLAEGPDAQRFPDARAAGRMRTAYGAAVSFRYRGMVVGDVAALELDPTSSSRVRIQLRIELERRDASLTTYDGVLGRASAFPRPAARTLRSGHAHQGELRPDARSSRSGDHDRPAATELLGRETPPDDLAEGELEDACCRRSPRHPRASGLRVRLEPGSPILFRGIQTGEVRRVQLASDGRGHRPDLPDLRELSPHRSRRPAASGWLVPSCAGASCRDSAWRS